MSDIWQNCEGNQQIGPIAGKLYRLVENQEQVATLSYVDDLAEQSVLEELLERSKPDAPNAADALHYLLKTPFRYPPLAWGSRFGHAHQSGIFYGGGSIETTLTESAFYRFVFWHSMQAAPPKPIIISQHSLFSARYQTSLGVKLQQPPFDRYRSQLADPTDYRAAQAVGTAMRDAGIKGFEYPSARDRKGGTCIGLFSPAALRDKHPAELSLYLCSLSSVDVSFKCLKNDQLYKFYIGDFQVEGKLPFPP